jgi:hypothetical protein
LETSVNDLSSPLIRRRVASSFASAIQRQRDSGTTEAVYAAAEEFATALRTARQQARDRERVSEHGLRTLAVRVRGEVSAPLTTHRGEVEALESQLADRGQALQVAEGKLRDVVAQIELDRRMPEIRIYVENAKQARCAQRPDAP